MSGLAGRCVAVIDVGSNSIKLLVAKRSGVGIETVFTKTLEARISAGISLDRPVLQEGPMAAGVAAIENLCAEAKRFSPEAIVIVATSAVRDAGNQKIFIEKVHAATGAELRVLSGSEEAIYIGKGIACDPAVAGIDAFVHMDIGGGSLELIRFVGGEIEQAISLQLGAVRLTERFIAERALPIQFGLKATIERHVSEVLDASGFDFGATTLPMVATGGAFVIARAILAGREGIALESSSSVLNIDSLKALELELSALPLVERAQVEHLPGARADIVPTALITILKMMELAGQQAVTHSLYNLRYGIASELLG